jgi:hypothetical protein
MIMKQKRIAICFSAQVRTALYAVDNIKKFFGPLWDQCDFFCHTWLKDTDKLFGPGESLFENKITVGQDTIDKLHEIYNFKKFKMENWEDLALVIPYEPPLFYSWIESVKLKQQYEQENNFTYDYVVKLRLDNIYSDNISLQSLIEKSEPNSLAVNDIMQNGSVDDFVFISDSLVSDKMIRWYTEWVKETKTFYAQLELPEFLKREQIKLISLGIDTNLPIGIGADIGILRLVCVNFDPIKDYKKCVEADKILYWSGPETVDQVWYLSQDDLIDLARRVKAKYNKLPNVLALFEDKI